MKIIMKLVTLFVVSISVNAFSQENVDCLSISEKVKSGMYYNEAADLYRKCLKEEKDGIKFFKILADADKSLIQPNGISLPQMQTVLAGAIFSISLTNSLISENLCLSIGTGQTVVSNYGLLGLVSERCVAVHPTNINVLKSVLSSQTADKGMTYAGTGEKSYREDIELAVISAVIQSSSQISRTDCSEVASKFMFYNEIALMNDVCSQLCP